VIQRQVLHSKPSAARPSINALSCGQQHCHLIPSDNLSEGFVPHSKTGKLSGRSKKLPVSYPKPVFHVFGQLWAAPGTELWKALGESGTGAFVAEQYVYDL